MPDLIHPTAIIADNATVHPTAQIGPYCMVDEGAIIGAGCVLDCYVRVYANVVLGKYNRLCQGAAVGVEPQDLSYTPDKAKPLVIGDYNHFKENTSISIGIKTKHGTRIGNHNYLMHAAHIAHDCILGDHNVIANSVATGGHTTIEDHVFISGSVAIHQFCRIGSYAMVAGVSGVRQDVPPYCTANGQWARFVGLNLVGLKRHGFSPAQRGRIKRAYQLLLKSGLPRNVALQQLKQQASSAEEQAIIDFAEKSERGLVSASPGSHAG